MVTRSSCESPSIKTGSVGSLVSLVSQSLLNLQGRPRLLVRRTHSSFKRPSNVGAVDRISSIKTLSTLATWPLGRLPCYKSVVLESHLASWRLSMMECRPTALEHNWIGSERKPFVTYRRRNRRSGSDQHPDRRHPVAPADSTHPPEVRSYCTAHNHHHYHRGSWRYSDVRSSSIRPMKRSASSQ